MSNENKSSFLIWPWLICAIYFCTGITALSYEVLWARMLSTMFGVSIFGVVVTISAFMAGLGFGSYIGSHLLKKIRSPLIIFAILELIVALFAFNLPALLSYSDSAILKVSSAESYQAWFAIQSIFTFILMFLPALGLGIGFPMVLTALKNTNISLGLVYGVNTLGGMIGALLPLMLLPAFGWTVSLRLVAILGILLAVLAFLVALFNSKSVQHKVESEDQISPGVKILLSYAGIGAAAIMLEVAWTRLFGMVLLRTEYVMAVILATFLVGIGLGSFIGTKIKNIFFIFIFAIVIACSGLASLYFLPLISEWAEITQFSSLSNSMFMQGLVISLFTLPATLAFGAWFPVIAHEFENKHVSGGLLYGANSIGAAIGGLTAGFVLLPLMGTTSVIVIATLLVFLSSLVWVKNRIILIAPIIVGLLFIPVVELPAVNQLLPSSQMLSNDLSIYEDAMTLTHVTENKDGQRLLLADLQRMDASTDPTAVRVQKNQARLPLLLHPNPETVLFLGLGTGITASGSLPYENLQRTSVELSRGAIIAAENWFDRSNDSIVKSTTVIQDDARRFLKTTEQKYDVIVGDLFHPDFIGRSALLSLQQFERSKQRLTQDGVFTQWVALNQFDLKTLKIVLATFKQVFPDAMIFMDGFRLALVGINGDFSGAQGMLKNISALNAMQKSEITGGEGIWTWASRYWGPIQVLEKKIQDEWAPVIEYELPKAKFNRQIDLRNLLIFMLKNRPNVNEAMFNLKVDESNRKAFSSAYRASELYVQSWVAYFSSNTDKTDQIIRFAYTENKKDQWIGFALADAMFATMDQAIEQGYDEETALKEILAIRNDHIGALKQLWQFYQMNDMQQKAKELRDKLQSLSPFDKDLKDF